ncbi:unnamed protein product [Cunninghamella echinulata]
MVFPIIEHPFDLSHYFMILICVIMILDILPSHISLKSLLGINLVIMLIQLINYTYLISNRYLYIQELLNETWQTSFENDPWFIQELEDDWQCRGFHNSYDRNIHDDYSLHTNKGCFYFMNQQFGNKIYKFALILWFIKWLQIFAGLLFFTLYDYYFKKENDHKDLEVSTDLKNIV